MIPTRVYIDGFNLYYRVREIAPDCKWLDPLQLCSIIVPKHQITHIKYFTAKVKARPYDPGQPDRQKAYLRALCTLPNLSIHYGHFMAWNVKMPLAANPQKKVEVIKTEEKGSDVNLATHLLADGFRGDYEAAIVISNDSDLVEPIRIVAKERGKKVGVLHPSKYPTHVLANAATFFKGIRKSALERSQFPDSLTDAVGSFQKPSTW